MCEPATAHRTSAEYLTLFLPADKMLKSESEIIFLGDFNIDMLQSNCNINLHCHTNPLTDFCDQFCLSNTIDEPTRVTKTSKSLIDVILVNRPEHWATSGSLQLGMSDHIFSILLRNVFNYKGILELCYFVIWQI